MQVFESADGCLVRLYRGEEIGESLRRLAGERGWRGGEVQGIGAVSHCEIGLYDLASREYVRREEPGILELLGFQGNLSLKDGAPFLHAHVVLLREDFSVAGGHLFRATVAVTGEFTIRMTDLSLRRMPDESVGLHLLEAGE